MNEEDLGPIGTLVLDVLRAVGGFDEQDDLIAVAWEVEQALLASGKVVVA